MEQDTNIWEYLYSVLDHGSSMSIIVTKTGLENEIMVAISPVPNSLVQSDVPFMPALFKGPAKTINDQIVIKLQESEFGKGAAIFQNRDTFNTLTRTYIVINSAINAGLNRSDGKGQIKDLRVKAKGHWKNRQWDKALECYTMIRSLLREPSNEVEDRIRILVQYITPQEPPQISEEEIAIPEVSDPFEKEKQGFGKIKKTNE